MKLSLRRKFKGAKYTIGDLSIDGTFFCNTIEDVIRELPDSCPNTSCWLESFANRIAHLYRCPRRCPRRYGLSCNTPLVACRNGKPCRCGEEELKERTMATTQYAE